MKGKARQKVAAAPRSRNAPRKSANASKPASSKRGQGKKAATKPDPEDDIQESPARVIRKQPARTKAADTKGKGKAAARDTPVPSGRGTPAVVADLPYTPVSRPSAAATSDSPDVPLAAGKRGDEEVATVIDEDEDMQVDVKEETIASSRKRRRTASTTKQPKGSRATITRAGSTSAPASKRLKLSPGNGHRSLVPGTRVIAPWKKDTYYYFGTVHSVDKTNPSRVCIFFDDETEETVDITKIRRADPHVGEIFVCNFGNNKSKAKIAGIERWEDERMLRIEMIDEDEGDELEVASTFLRLAPRTVEVNWSDRKLAAEDIIPLVGGKSLKDRSPSKMSVMSNGEVKNPKVLHKTAVAITLPGDLSSQRVRYERAVAALGGSVIEWSDAFGFQGKSVAGGKRWFMRKEDVKYVGKNGISRLMLLSDDYCTRPKFLLALALGIPCVGFDWLEASASSNEEVDWAGYLLPAGVSTTISARTSQLVDLDWGNCLEHITNIMTNPVPAKVFTDMSILCLGAEFVSKKSTEGILEGSLVIPRLILCMGAAYVEAVANVTHASFDDLTEYDYIVVKEASTLPISKGETYVDVGWVKDCLISSRLLASPQQNK
ncbi:hypothetical protein SCHPADRAFT_448195 [Schizopora paradoxa]|uniref:Tudor domain-containing protein n=1 Tax=Schizopora paradoxa TaxID=27342 RepID=A0A0H2RIL8_9AGAM|nr:hypothetical protein SCHPADRAFT_448195 [Schizopora paradoxa]